MKVTKDQYQSWLQFCEQVQSDTPVVATETEKEKNARIERLKKNYAEFFAYYFPNYATSKTAKFHSELASKIVRFKRARGVFEAFRGAAKSVHATVGIPFWLMCKGEMKTMLLVGETEDKAILLLSSIQAQLESNQRIKADYGDQVRYGAWETGKFITTGNVAFIALGLGQNPRGARNAQNRPDYIVCDDLDSKERCKNPKRVREAVEWVLDDLMGCFDIGNERFILCNNRIHKNSILAGVTEALRASAGFFHMKVNALDAKGQSSWPEKYPTQYWIDKRAETAHRSWEREYMNNPIEEGTIFSADWMHECKILPLPHYEAIVAYCDPSFKDSNKSDYKAVVVLGKTGSELHIIDAFVRQTSISELVKWFYDFDQNKPERAVVRYYMEANFIQDLLLGEFVEEGKKRGYQLPITADKRKKPDKFQRIEAISPLFERGFVLFNEARKENQDFLRLKEQLLSFEKGNRGADDAPDALEGAISIMKHAVAVSQPPAIGQRQKNNKRL